MSLRAGLLPLQLRLPVAFQFSSIPQSYPTLCDPMDCTTPSYAVHHQLPEFTQTHVHRVDDAIQPSHPLSSPSPAFSLTQHRGLFEWVSSSHQVAKVLGVSASASVLPMNIQDWFPLGWTGCISLQSKGLSKVSSNTTVQKHQRPHLPPADYWFLIFWRSVPFESRTMHLTHKCL